MTTVMTDKLNVVQLPRTRKVVPMAQVRTKAPAGTQNHRLTANKLGLDLQAGTWLTVPGTHVKIFSTVVYVSPEMAREWLESYDNQLKISGPDHRFLKQRKRNSRGVEDWLTSMRQGHWQFQPHSIFVFTEDGFLLDGQHRLAAVAQLDEPVLFRVEIGWPEGVFPAIDSGRRRMAYQLINTGYAANVAGAVRYLKALETGVMTEMSPYVRKMSTDETLELVSQHPEFLQTIDGTAEGLTLVTATNKVYQATQINMTMHLAVMSVAIRTQYADRIPEWMATLESGAGLETNDPRLKLRNRWMSDRTHALSRGSRAAGIAMIIKAWNAYVLGETMGLLRHNPADEFPRVVGWKYPKDPITSPDEV